MELGQVEGDGLLSRAEMEIELARLVLQVDRRRAAAAGNDTPEPAFVAWFEEAALELLQRVAPDLRPFVLERLGDIAQSNAGLEISQLKVDASTLSFTPIEGAQDG